MEVKETFLCTFCGKGFTKKANLESHITLHTGEKRYSCTQCDKKFRSHSVYQVTSLKDKYLTVAKIVVFSEPSSVSQGQKGVCVHLLWKGIHAEISPSKTHRHAHRGEKPHLPSKIVWSCYKPPFPMIVQVCQKTFIEPGDVRKHMRTHSKESIK